MKKLLLFFSFLILIPIAIGTSLFAQTWLWGADGTGTLKASDNGGEVATDKAGNAYMAGNYQSAITFGSYRFTNIFINTFLVKYNSSGAIQWATQPTISLINITSSECNSVATDISGNIYITGFFHDTITFGSFKLISPNAGAYIAKYAPNGTVLWARQSNNTPSGNSSNCTPLAVTTDRLGNAYITGYFNDTVSFGSFTLNVANNSYSNVFTVKYDSNGNVVWAEKGNVTPGVYGGSSGNSITVDKDLNSYITGYFQDTLVFGRDTLFTPGSVDVFLVKYNSNGNVVWCRRGTPPPLSGYLDGAGYSVITDNSGKVYLTGSYTGTLSFGIDSLGTTIYTTIFLAKYDSSGNVLWAEKSYGVADDWTGYSLSKDTSDNIYMSGGGTGDSLIFGGAKFRSGSLTPAFMLKLDTAGKVKCGSLLHNGASYASLLVNYNGINCASDPTGNYIYMGGTFYNSAMICGPDTLVASSGGDLPYVARWQSCASDFENVNNLQPNNSRVVLYPNPSNGIFTIEIKSEELITKSTVAIYNMLGEEVYKEALPQAQGDNAIDLSSQANGVYLYRVVNENGNLAGEGKFIIQR